MLLILIIAYVLTGIRKAGSYPIIAPAGYFWTHLAAVFLWPISSCVNRLILGDLVSYGVLVLILMGLRWLWRVVFG